MNLPLAIDISLSDSLQQTFDDIGRFLPKLVAAIVIFLVLRFVAKVIYKAVHKLLTRAKVDALVDKSGLGGPLESAGFADSAVFLAKLVYWMLMFVVIKVTFDILDVEALTTLIDDLVAWMPKLIVAIIIVFLTGAIANFVKGLVSAATSTQSWGNAATTAAAAGIWFIGGMAALDQVEVAADLVDTLTSVVFASLGAILVIKFGIGGIWSARDRFWPGVYDKFGSAVADTSDNA